MTRSGLGVKSIGLRNLNPDQIEVQAEVNTEDLITLAEEFLHFTFNYLKESGRTLFSQETLSYGYWVVKFFQENEVLNVWGHLCQLVA